MGRIAAPTKAHMEMIAERLAERGLQAHASSVLSCVAQRDELEAMLRELKRAAIALWEMPEYEAAHELLKRLEATQ